MSENTSKCYELSPACRCTSGVWKKVSAIKLKVFCAVVLWLSLCVSAAKADIGGPTQARHAVSPDGQLLVRITTPDVEAPPEGPPKHEVSYYEFDSEKDSYVRRSGFEMTGFLGEMLYVSNSGDLVLISLGTKEAIRLFAKDGALVKSWNLGSFLSEREIKAGAKTGSTLQWLEEGIFYDRVFYFRGPSQIIRALEPPFTIMRGVDEEVTFSATIDLKNATLTKIETEDP